MSIDQTRSCFHLIVAGVQTTIADIVGHRTGKEERILEYDAHLATQAGTLDLTDVDVVDGNSSRLYVVETSDEVGDCGFSSPGHPHQGDRLPGFSNQAKVLKHRFTISVCKGDVFESHSTFDRWHFDGIGRVVQCHRFVEKIEYSLPTG